MADSLHGKRGYLQCYTLQQCRGLGHVTIQNYRVGLTSNRHYSSYKYVYYVYYWKEKNEIKEISLKYANVSIKRTIIRYTLTSRQLKNVYTCFSSGQFLKGTYNILSPKVYHDSVCLVLRPYK
jgi:hypothetical protein